MFKHYFLVAIRNLKRHTAYASINVLGLAIGIAVCILIALFVRNEWSYDAFHAKSDHLYRAWVFEDYGEDEQFLNTTTPLPLGPVLTETFPEIEAFVRVIKTANQVQIGVELIPQDVHIVDPNFFDVFSFALKEGLPDRVFGEVNNAVLSEAAAQKYFGQTNPIDQTIMLQSGDEFVPYTITGIAEIPPVESSIQYEILIPFSPSYYSERALTAWFNVGPETYVVLRDDASITALESKIPELSKTILGDDYLPGVYNIGLQPMTSIHLDTSLPAGSEPISNPQYSYVMLGIALLILLIACINFMTLAIGRSVGRSLEVGIRKVLGARQGQVRTQFWGEAILMTVIALVVGLALAAAALPAFSRLAGTELSFVVNVKNILFLGGLVLTVGLVAGSYPAIVLSALRPMDVIKGKQGFRGRRQLIQRSMVVFQLSLSVILIIGALGMQRQLNFLQTTSLGFDKELAVVIPTNMTRPDGLATSDRFRDILASDPDIVSVAAASFNIGDGWGKAGYTDQNGTYRTFRVNIVTPEYLQTLGVRLTNGRDYDRAATDDLARGIIVNEALVAEYGWDDPIGKLLPGGDFGDHQIIGVVEDFHYSTLRSEVLPLVLMINSQPIFSGIENYDGYSSFQPEMTIRFQASALVGIADKLEDVWNQVAPGQTFDYQFLDETVDDQYRAEKRLGNIMMLGTVLSIVVACLGLFGLATLVTVRRIKEIGIRKTMGASASKITLMISTEFAVLAGLAVLIASPIAYLGLTAWLQGFAYSSNVSIGLFVVAAVLTIAVSLLTVSFHAVRAARIDPVRALRYE